MIHLTRLLLFSLCCSQFLRVSAQAEFTLNLGSMNIFHISEMRNGDLTVGFDDISNGAIQHTISRFSQNGQEIWAFRYDLLTSSLSNRGHRVREAPSGALYVNMYLDSANTKQGVLRLKADGNLDWARTHSSFLEHLACSDGSVLLAGLSSVGGIVTKLDSTGNKIWANRYTFGYPTFFSIRSIVEYSNGYYIIGGSRPVSFTNAPYDVIVLKIDLMGNPVWALKLGERTTHESCEEATILPDESIVLLTTLGSGNNRHQGLARISPAGQPLWWTEFGGTSTSDLLDLTRQGTILASVRSAIGLGLSHAILMEADTNGNLLHAVPGSSTAQAMVIGTENGDYAYLGKGSFFGGGPPVLSRYKTLRRIYCQPGSSTTLTTGSYPPNDSMLTMTVFNNAANPSIPAVPWAATPFTGLLLCDTCRVDADFSFQASGGQVSFTDSSLGLVGGWHWDFGDGAIDSVQNPIHNYAASGQYQVCLISYEGRCTDSICYTVNVNLVGLPDPVSASAIWPNPTTGLVHVRTNGAVLDYEVMDLTGRTFAVAAWDAGEGKVLDLSKLPAALYLLRLKGGLAPQTFRIMLLHD